MELEEIKLARKMEIWEAQLPVICQQEHSKPSQWNTGFFTVKVYYGWCYNVVMVTAVSLLKDELLNSEQLVILFYGTWQNKTTSIAW